MWVILFNRHVIQFLYNIYWSNCMLLTLCALLHESIYPRRKTADIPVPSHQPSNSTPIYTCRLTILVITQCFSNSNQYYPRPHHQSFRYSNRAVYSCFRGLLVVIRGPNVCSYSRSSLIVSHSGLNVISYSLLPLLSSHSGSCKQSSWILLWTVSQASSPSAYLSDSMLVATCGLPHHRLLNTIIVEQTPAP
jgi:hypothetical protein